MARTINTSNSSKHLNGASMASQREMMKQTVVNDRSPPDKDFVFLVDFDMSVCRSVFTLMSRRCLLWLKRMEPS